ncbi:uncharacterized protein [Coffea arabica]|uniref:RRM domain-containing protein n=1 Tax=Coffea arabica TaxID=13443 RepID=A0A6P6U3I8_COFAR|nr:nucleolar protein 12-like [Coffea arabica]
MAKSAKKPKGKKPPEESNTLTASNSKPDRSNSENLNVTTAPESDSNVFSSLFGEIREENSTNLSIFSNNNPFRRKPGNPSSERPIDGRNVQTGLALENPNGEKAGNFENSDGPAELKKRKWKEEKKGDIEEEELGRKKLKRVGGNGGKTKDKMEENGVTASTAIHGGLVDNGNAVDEEKKGKKKKRKRDEVEAEYEAKRYGVEEEGRKEERGGLVGVKRKEMDSLEDVMVSKEGFDDEIKLLRTVFVGNLPLKIKKKVLIREFGKFGEVESVRIRSVPLNDSKIPRKGAIMKKQINETADSVHAYVVFKTEESAQASLAHNMAVVSGNHIRVDRACPPRKKLKGDNAPLYDNKRTVFVGNLPFDVKDEELYQLFSSIKNLESSIEAIRIVRDPGTSLGKGIAYMLFKTKDAADMVIRRRNLKLRDRDLRLYHAKAETTLSKRKSPLPTNTPPAKKFGGKTKFASLENKTTSKAASSYQGLRASKSGIQKKTHRPAANSQKVPMQKERQQKRPAVAARKAKALKAKQAGIKRKLDKQTPDSIHQKKKARRFT